LPNINRIFKARSIRWVWHVARTEEERNAYRVLMGKPEEKIPLEIPIHMLEDNIKMVLRKIGWGVLCWIRLFQDRD
jgi:hypothetical protein